MSDHSFTFDGEHYSSLMDFLGGAGDNMLSFLEPLSRQREDQLRAAINAYTEQMQENQAKTDVGAEERELDEAVKTVSNLVEWGNNVAGRTGLDPWENAQAFLDSPWVKHIRERLKLKLCKDHWHCEWHAADPECHAADEKADRTKPCPSCGQPESNESFTERVLEALAQLLRESPVPSENAARDILAEGRQKGLLP